MQSTFFPLFVENLVLLQVDVGNQFQNELQEESENLAFGLRHQMRRKNYLFLSDFDDPSNRLENIEINQLFVHLQQGGMDLYLCENESILFQNHFSVKNEDEFLYYLFFVVEQYKLNYDSFQIVFLGQIKAFESYYKAIMQYHSRIRFEESETCNSLEMEQHPAPFFAQSYT